MSDYPSQYDYPMSDYLVMSKLTDCGILNTQLTVLLKFLYS